MYSFKEIITHLTVHQYDPPEKKLPSLMDLIVFITFIKDEVDLEIKYEGDSIKICFDFEGHRISISRLFKIENYRTIKDFILSVASISDNKQQAVAYFVMRFVDRGNGFAKRSKAELYLFNGPNCYCDVCLNIEELFVYMVDSHLKSLKRYHSTIQNNDSP